MPFDQAQLRAIRHRDGPMLVLAGPGSGKTTVIVNRIQFLTGECRVPPEQILVITFTKAAALEMQKRYEEKAHGALPVFGTFHSIFFSMLRRHCGFSAKSLIQTKDQYAVLKKILQDPQLPMIYTDDLAELLLAEISRTKNKGGITDGLKAVENEGDSACAPELFPIIYRRYNTMLRNMKLLDFDDMLLLCRELFSEHPDCLLEEQERFRYLLVDEFQDINALQYEILRMLAGTRRNLFIVGDDDQSIYGFRGSEPRIMLGFEKDYPGCKTVLLSKNYRSGAVIVNAASRLIGHNRMRFRKQISAGRELAAFVKIEICETEREELLRVKELFLQYRRQGIADGEIAVLYRTNAEVAALKQFLKQEHISFSEAGKKAAEKTAGTEKLPAARVPEIAATADGKMLAGARQNCLQLATFHSSKGLEFTVVMILAASEGITPHRKSDTGDALEEERRMFYVAVTRAKQYLHILNTKSRYNKPRKLSRFAEEMQGKSRV